jgi:transposase-like protein
VKAWAIHAYTEIGVTLERVAKEVFDLFNVRVTLVTIRNWVLNAERVQNNFKHAAGGVWHVDETVIHSNGEKWWIWIVVERRARRVLAWLVSNNRRKKNARRVFEKAVAAAGGLPSIIVSDGYKGYASVFKRYDVVHVVDSAFGFNALIERVNREVKKRLKYFKCNVSKKLVEALLAAWFAAYHVRFHHGLGCTPLEAGAAATSTKL